MAVTTRESNIVKADEWFTNTERVFEDTIFQADGVTPEDITGWLVTFLLMDISTLVEILTKSVGSGILLNDAPNGKLQITIDATDTIAVLGADSPLYVFEIRRTDASDEAVVTYGSAVLRQSLTL